jgi:hypothetical protein
VTALTALMHTPGGGHRSHIFRIAGATSLKREAANLNLFLEIARRFFFTTIYIVERPKMSNNEANFSFYLLFFVNP